MSLNAFAHVLVCAFRRDEIVFLIAASGASFSSSQKRCVVGRDVVRHARRQRIGEPRCSHTRAVAMVGYVEATSGFLLG